MKNKPLLIVEQSKSILESKSTDGHIVLEGIFTEFNVRNRNHRIYEAKDVLPFIEELQEKIKSGKLLGELDHPKDFDISLSNVSHVIEDLHFDAGKQAILGRIRLLNTTKGKEAQSLVQDGIPLHVSSRARGSVNEKGVVKINKLFTYDLVADPGFANAELSIVNEAFGVDADDSLFIYEMKEDESTQINNKKIEYTMNGVSVEDFNKYTEQLKSVIEHLEKEVTQLKEDLSTSVNYTELVESKLENGIKFTEHVAEHLGNTIKFTEHIAENVENGIKFTEHVAENVENGIKFTEHIAEHVENGIKFTEHIAEHVENGIKFAEHIAEHVENGIKFTEHVAENVENGIRFTEHVAENVENGIKFTEHVAENAKNGISYLKYVAEHLDNSITFTEHVSESMNSNTITNRGRKANVGVTEGLDSYKNSISTKIDTLLEQLKLNNDNSKILETKTVEENKVNENEKKIASIIDSIPESYAAKWDNLSTFRKEQILAESKTYNLVTDYAKYNFWTTRDFRETPLSLQKLNESLEQPADTKKSISLDDNTKEWIVNKIKHNLGR